MKKKDKEIKKIFISILLTFFVIFSLSLFYNFVFNIVIFKKRLKEENIIQRIRENNLETNFDYLKSYIFPGIFVINDSKLNKYEKILLEQVNPYGILLLEKNLIDVKQFEALKKEIEEILKRKVIFFIDQEGGVVSRTKIIYKNKKYATASSSSYEITNDLEKSKELAYKNGEIIAKDIKKLGINVNLAPILDIKEENNNLLGSRTFGKNPNHVSILSNEYIKAHKDNDIEVCVKHFIGLGKCNVDTHKKKCIIDSSLDELKNKDLIPFYNLKNIKYGMLSHAIYTSIDPENPASLSNKIIDFIRDELKFEGILITDALHMEALDEYGTKKEKILKSLNAGVDLVLIMKPIRRNYELENMLKDILEIKKELFIKNQENKNLIIIDKNIYFN